MQLTNIWQMNSRPVTCQAPFHSLMFKRSYVEQYSAPLSLFPFKPNNLACQINFTSANTCQKVTRIPLLWTPTYIKKDFPTRFDTVIGLFPGVGNICSSLVSMGFTSGGTSSQASPLVAHCFTSGGNYSWASPLVACGFQLCWPWSLRASPLVANSSRVHLWRLVTWASPLVAQLQISVSCHRCCSMRLLFRGLLTIFLYFDCYDFHPWHLFSHNKFT